MEERRNEIHNFGGNLNKGDSFRYLGIGRKIILKVKVKVKLSQCLTKHHAMKAYWGVEVYLHAFFHFGTRWR
jgi:hypothetical protein